MDTTIEQHLDEDQLAHRLNIPQATVEYWRRHHLGPPYIRVGRHVRYRLGDVLAWEASQTNRPRGRSAA